jgi:hypothetical protein
MKSAPFFAPESVGTSFRSYSLSMHSAAERLENSTETQDVSIGQDVLPAAAPAVKPSAVFTPTSKRQRRLQYVPSNPSLWATLEETLTNLILPGVPPTAPPKTRTPSEVLGCLVPCRRTAGPKPSDIFCANKPTPERRFTSRLVSIAPKSKAVIFHKKAYVPNTNEGCFTSRLVSNTPKPKLVISHKTPISTMNDEKALVTGNSRPADKEVSLRITVLRHRALRSGMEMPSRLIPVPVAVAEPA